MTFLSDILKRKRGEVSERKAQRSENDLRVELSAAGTSNRSHHRLFEALSSRSGPVKIIAEIKRASPSVGQIDASLDPVELAIRYQSAGAAAVSVLTDGPGFGGSLGDLQSVRQHVSLPLLRKDFVVDVYQLVEARLAGADAALLIVAALDEPTLESLHRECSHLGLDALVEVHDSEELKRALGCGAKIIGINNRDLKTFAVDLATTEKLVLLIPESVRAIAESGIKGPVEIARLKQSGARNFLVGEALVRASDVEEWFRTAQ